MIKATLRRNKDSDKVTFGQLTFDNGAHPPIYTLERAWNNNAPDNSCIPLGLYNVIPYSSMKHPDVWEVLNVPGRDYILMHNGNYSKDTLGCIVVGLTREITVPMVGRSDDCIDFLRGYLKKQNFSLEIS